MDGRHGLKIAELNSRHCILSFIRMILLFHQMHYMRRIVYGPSEYNNNAAAVADGVSKLGGPDKSETRLWWNPAK